MSDVVETEKTGPGAQGFESEDLEVKSSCASRRGREPRGRAQTPGAMVSDALNLKCP